jgi:hypothetical protein
MYDLTNIQTALSVLPFVLALGAFLFWMGSKYYIKDLTKVAPIRLEAQD